jgi:very-short-patch-repair endonuclease
MTDSERKLWSCLRLEQLGVKFRRQHPLGNYIADFACLAPKLIIELDGSQHVGREIYDSNRDAYMRGQGYAVLRFATNEPLINLEGVLTVILEQLTSLAGTAPIPTFPQRGKE